jgi:hydroxyacylglutathione hydrolase
VPALQDNYSYLIIDEVSGSTAAVDVNDAQKVVDYFLEAREYYSSKRGLQLSLTHVFCTHRHWDHAGGNEALLEIIPSATVVVSGAAGRERSASTKGSRGYQWVCDSDTVSLGACTVRVIHVPFHTQEHVVYYIEDSKRSSPLLSILDPLAASNPVRGRGGLFTGDAVFVGGVGKCKFFEGTAVDCYNTIYNKLSKIEEEVIIFPGHGEILYLLIRVFFTLDVSNTSCASHC